MRYSRVVWWGAVALLATLVVVALLAPELAGAMPETRRWALSTAPGVVPADGNPAAAVTPQLPPGATSGELWRWWVRATRNVVLVTASVATLALVLGGV